MTGAQAVIVFMFGIAIMGIALKLSIPMIDNPNDHYETGQWAGMGATWVIGFLLQLKANQELKLI